jgi:non-heme chloroperoxidase
LTAIRAVDGAEIFYKDWGPQDAPPIVFHHGWPLSADDWDAQLLFFLKQGYRVIAHDRRGHGRSTQTYDGNDMDTYASDVAALVTALDLRNVIHVGHSTGGGEATRYVARHGKERTAALVLIGAVPPILVKSASNPDGVPIEVFDGLRDGIAANRSAFYWDFIVPFYGYNRPGATVNEQVRLNWWRQAMMGGAYPQSVGIKAFSETNFAEDLKSIEAPVFFMHGDDDQIVPLKISAEVGVTLVKHGTLKVYPGFPHGMATTHADQINADLLEFIKAQQQVSTVARRKFVVIGGTGLIGSKLVGRLRARGQEVIAASPESGVNTLTGQGLAEALAGAQVVVDVSNSPSFEDHAVMDFFMTSGRNLLAAEAAAGVKHHVALSIVGTHRVADSGYLRAKAAQEDLIKSSAIPYSILESTQFFEFIDRIAKDSLADGAYHLSPALMQPIVSDEVVAALADIALGPPLNATVEIGGPEAIPIDELGRELLSAKGDTHQIIEDRHARYYGAELEDRSLVPGPEARLGSLKFADWLRQSAAPH